MTAGRRPARSAADPPPERRDRWRRWILAAQGAYYVLTGLWSIIHFSSFTRAVALTINPFQAHAFAAVIVVVGANLAEAARRDAPGRFPTQLGAAVAGAIALVELIWLPRLGPGGALWLDFVVEVAFVVALIVLYPRNQTEDTRSRPRRR